jgi:hypothetical protein
MLYGITWESECLADLEEIFGDLAEADDAIHAIDWRLSRDPLGRATWEVVTGSEERLTWLRPHREFPAVAFSYRVGQDERGRQCFMLRARRANVAASS